MVLRQVGPHSQSTDSEIIMGRRKSSDGDNVSLFPFMSILVCLIGALTLMIAALMISSMNSKQAPEIVERYKQYSELKADQQQDREELERLKQLLAQADKLAEQTKLALAEVAALEATHKDKLASVDANSEYAKQLADANRLRLRIAELEAEPAKLQVELDRLQQEVAKKNAGPEEKVVQIRPGGSGADLVPTFVECTATGLVIHDSPQPKRIVAADIGNPASGFPPLLDQVAGTPKGQVIFLVRPDGVDVFNVARNFARGHFGPNGYCKNGKLPVPTQGNIDLSVFRK